ncbi:hypothetical protein GALMADRAFT_276756 [Galerina marginata CBS 339.88]|uniref:Uncharacterized protein n=1 Tax=Galerina marginata (strain CBS 339.88) TaxID=685588 RepID=A0A067TQK9_GALM3|nr:hypothetical protein GALMADRAFT_276756 [Galerina marginata CBS 339.88]
MPRVHFISFRQRAEHAVALQLGTWLSCLFSQADSLIYVKHILLEAQDDEPDNGEYVGCLFWKNLGVGGVSQLFFTRITRDDWGESDPEKDLHNQEEVGYERART